jgi:hypothetical protein
MRPLGILLLAALAAALPMQSIAGGALAAPPRHASAQTAVLFQWKIPKKGQVGAWKAKNGVLSYDGASVGAALPRYTVPAHANFAVQAMIRTTGPGAVSAALNGFGLIAREQRSNPHTSVAGGSFFDANFQTNQEDNMPELYWNGQTIGQMAFQPGNAWHLYRLAVQGDLYSLSIDGKPMVAYTVTDYPSPTSVGVFAWYYQVQVKRFEVDSIGPQATPVPFDPVPRDANITVSDLPTTGFYLPYLHHWYSNEESARESNVSVASLQTAGRVVSYGVDYYASSRDFSDIYSAITEFGTAAQAQAFYQARLQVLRQTGMAIPGAHDFQDLSGLGLGDASGGFRVDGGTQGLNVRAIVIFFVRGRYTALLRVSTDPDPDWAPDAARSVQQVTDLGRIIDGRLPHA